MMLPGIMLMAHLSIAAGVPPAVAGKGISDAGYQELRKARVLGDFLENTEGQCGNSDRIPFAEKTLLADALVRGKITAIEYLYKEGGPFRTLYTLEISETLRGNAPLGQAKILERSGPVTRDHTKWRRPEGGIRLQVGDAGFFLLEQEPLKHLAAQYPAHADYVKDRWMFQGGLRGVYLEKDGELDAAFLSSSEKSQPGLKTAEVRKAASAIRAALRERGAQ